MILLLEKKNTQNEELYNSMCFIVLDILLDFVTIFEREIATVGNPVISEIFAVIQKMQPNRNVGFVHCLYDFVWLVLTRYHHIIFAFVSSFPCFHFSQPYLTTCFVCFVACLIQ